MLTIEVLNPTYEDPKQDAGFMAPRTQPESPIVIAVIENSKPHAKELLTYLADGLRERLPIGEVLVHSKPTASKPIDRDEAEMLAARAHLVISGLGD